MELIHNKPDIKNLPGGWEYETNDFNLNRFETSKVIDTFQFLTESECKQLINIMNLSPCTEKVSVYGMKDFKSDEIGSVRTTIWSESISKELWKGFEHKLKIKLTDEFTRTDSWQFMSNDNKLTNYWKPVGCSPMLRFMKYENGGKHNAHYDSAYFYPGTKFRTLKSFVIYLNDIDPWCGGETRFIEDYQDDIFPIDRDYSDWINPTPDNQVYFSCKPSVGKVLVFDHRLCHDVSEYTGKEKRIIIRGDIIYQNVKNK